MHFLEKYKGEFAIPRPDNLSLQGPKIGLSVCAFAQCNPHGGAEEVE